MSKNIPGKVKISAPNLQGMKQKQKQFKKKKWLYFLLVLFIGDFYTIFC